jgi:hypothetical protein
MDDAIRIDDQDTVKQMVERVMCDVLTTARNDAPTSVSVATSTPTNVPVALNRNQNAMVSFSQHYEAHHVQQTRDVIADRQRRSFLSNDQLAHVMAERGKDFMTV